MPGLPRGSRPAAAARRGACCPPSLFADRPRPEARRPGVVEDAVVVQQRTVIGHGLLTEAAVVLGVAVVPGVEAAVAGAGVAAAGAGEVAGEALGAAAVLAERVLRLGGLLRLGLRHEVVLLTGEHGRGQ